MKAVRRVVTGFNEAGKSCVVSDGPAPSVQSIELWQTRADSPLGSDPGAAMPALYPPPGASQWRIIDIPPYPVLREYLRRGIEHHDEYGFHCTESIDYILVLEGRITLVLDDGEVLLHPGDCVVQRRTRHLWRNDGDSPVRILAVLIGLPAPQT